jgi:cytochrome P450
VSIPIYAFQNLETHFENPHEYLPERWLNGQHATFMPFLYGPMGCIGKTFVPRGS